MTNKQLALNNFKNQLEELETLNFINRLGWKSFTKEIIIKYLGPDSKFLGPFVGPDSIFYSLDNYGDDMHTSRITMQQCIKYIELNGVYEEPNSNFISRMSEGWATFWAGCLVTVFGGGGYFIGVYTTTNKVDVEKIALHAKVNSLEKQQSILRMRLTDSPAKKEAAHAHDPDNKY